MGTYTFDPSHYEQSGQATTLSGGWILPAPTSPGLPPVSPAPGYAPRRDDTAAWQAYASGEYESTPQDSQTTTPAGQIYRVARRQARQDMWVRLAARVFCTLLTVGLLIFGFGELINGGVDVGAFSLPLAALVMGGGTLVALVFAMTES